MQRSQKAFNAGVFHVGFVYRGTAGKSDSASFLMRSTECRCLFSLQMLSTEALLAFQDNLKEGGYHQKCEKKATSSIWKTATLTAGKMRALKKFGCKEWICARFGRGIKACDAGKYAAIEYATKRR